MAIKQILLKLLDDDADLVAYLDNQENRSETIRLAIRLLMELDNGTTALLYDLYPELADKPEPTKPETNDPDLKKKVEFHDQVIQSIIARGLQAPAADTPATDYHMAPVQMTPPKPRPPVIMEPPTDAAGDGSSANNLLASLDAF